MAAAPARGLASSVGLGVAALVGVGVLALRRTLVLVRVTSGSMSPTVLPDDQLLAVRCSPGRVRRGEVVLADLPPAAYSWDDPRVLGRDHREDLGSQQRAPAAGAVARRWGAAVPAPWHQLGPVLPADRFIKRVVGLGGDVVSGADLARASPVGRDLEDVRDRRWLLPPGSMFVVGDGPESDDSVRWGPVPVALVRARVVLVRTPGVATGWRRVGNAPSSVGPRPSAPDPRAGGSPGDGRPVGRS